MPNHEYFMEIALEEAKKALAANEFPVGCVMAFDDQIVARGKREHSRTLTRDGISLGANELDHAEIMALRHLVATQPEIDHSRVTVYCTMEPCLMCFGALLLSNIHTIVYAYEDAMGGGTSLPLAHLTPLYREMKVSIVPHILRDESLLLFKEFFLNPENSYWRNSFLADYTLSQK
ncbi:MAG: nucleoside deaminase [Desulfobulbaceae bacterium]|nr:nucleoside deaminase [Desulfobulbaceae bacterium]